MNYKFLFAAFLLLSNVSFAQKKDKSTLESDTTSRELNEVTISSKYYQRYKIDNVSGSLKLNKALLLVPQNIQEIDKSIIRDQQAINVNESITRNVSGTIRNNTADFYGPLIFMRGAGISTLRNGMDISMIYYGPLPEDASIIDRMEFIKGPAGFMNAIGDPAGSFNIVTKNPTGVRSNNISFTAGSFNLYRLTGDFDGSFGKNKKWQYRLNVAGQKAQSFQKFAFNDKVVVQPVIRYNINSKSSLTAEYIYGKQSFQQYLVTVFSPYGFGSLPRDFSITDPNKKPAQANENNGFLTYRNQLSDKWQFTAKATYARSHLDGNYFFVSAYNKTTPNLIQRRLTYERFNSSVYALQTFVNGQFSTVTITHHVLASFDYNRKNFLGYAGYNDPKANPALYPLDALNPVYGITFDSNERTGKLSDIATNMQFIEYYAGYVQDELNLLNDKLRITLAARLTSSKNSVSLPKPTSVSDVVVTPRIGLSYSIVKDLSVYGLFDHTYTPQSGISATGGVFEPLKGKNLEAGLKKDWADGKWNTSVSVYQIIRDNIIVTDPNNNNFQSQIGQTKSKGVEFDLKGEIFKGLNAVVNYAYTDSYISKDANESNVGLPSPYLVKHIQNTWLNYKLPVKKLNGLSVSAGYQFQAGRKGRYSQDGNLPISNLFRVDGGLGWSNSRISVNGVVNNIFNRFNYGSAWTRPVGLFAYVPYAPREYRITVGYNF
ncbi:TonB-dependent siderophore receptor [Dyadobacter frigoris]|uniref:TonB-dependent siderophore receptor n=1 Tax=Dyadobacter frigoris TaxID=2576211 RepID=A0A4V6BKZ3_9BACT|nr:TonB-dependent siderophore receptor [Dyadobacter frigoris]TKT92823.1 TonB-dependent siderophore receptor [Dyadobacter frigoris]GLU54411.1 TonB-dependent receptor [Dyadobacter frigoris]